VVSGGKTIQIGPSFALLCSFYCHSCLVLGRIDVIDVKGGPTVLAKSYLHPSLRVRVVQTKDAPEHATVPDGHIKRVSKLIRYATKAQNTKLVENFSLPLKPHIWKERYDS
jgi:hypothetical protein